MGVLGDFCLDAYWTIDDTASEASIETGLPTRPVRRQRYELGGAGNVISNLLALGVERVTAFGVVGNDPFGRELTLLLGSKHAESDGILVQEGDWETPVYIKPIREEREENRIDFGNFNRLQDEVAAALLDQVERALPNLDVVIINQQLRNGIHTQSFQAVLNAMFRQHRGKVFIVDARHDAGVYENCIHKLNDLEAARLSGYEAQPRDVITLDQAQAAGQQLFTRWGQPVFITRGARGCLVVDAAGTHHVQGLHIVNPVDSVGAGDSFLAGVAASLAAGCAPDFAAAFGNFVAGVTVQKLFQTGTASPAEVLAIGKDPDYVYEPELADDLRRAHYRKGTEIEVIGEFPSHLKITHAIFDHDGTISTLRQGWEAVMEPMMIKAILGDRYATADETLYARVVRRVREFIDQTTGIQTLVQMQGLAKLVREFGIVPEHGVLDESRYKEVYLDALMELVRERLRKLKRSELDVADFTLKNAHRFLQRLRTAGVKLYLASGTDERDVEAEAEALGYGALFEGRIYGAVGDVTIEAKRVVLDRILTDIGSANAKQVVVFGDGPVEIRESRKRGGLAVGIASDEVRRYGLNASKRSRLIRAGAHVIVPDYSQMEALVCLTGL